MKPISPVIEGFQEHEVVLAKDQPQYQPLPVLIPKGAEGITISRWHLSFWEKLRVLWFGSIWIQQMTFGGPLQPQLPSVKPPKVELTWPKE